ncbi:rhodanese-like domain-containing protein [Thalassotalea euphylliae]|uniref:rhodanese-like domain-containing protein n=1 Tax=Thalassotalea euphylliae TaxID=1655234 RepID=UPI00363FD507
MIRPVSDLVSDAQQHVSTVSVDEYLTATTHFTIIDVREKEEVNQGMLPNATHMSKGMLEFQIANHPDIQAKPTEIEKSDTNILLYCRSGQRSILAAKSLMDMGFKQVHSLTGGYTAWLEKT